MYTTKPNHYFCCGKRHIFKNPHLF